MVSFKFLFIVAILVFSVVAASIISAASAEKVVRIDRISTLSDSGDTIVVVGLKSQEKVTDSRVTVSIPELGLRARRNVEFDKNSRQNVNVVIPDSGSLDNQYVRIVFNSDQGRRVVYRQVIVE